jgi:hypothetical protein
VRWLCENSLTEDWDFKSRCLPFEQALPGKVSAGLVLKIGRIILSGLVYAALTIL